MAVTDSMDGRRWSGSGIAARASAQRGAGELVDLLDVPEAAWSALAARAIEPNGFYHPAWARAVARHAEGKSGARALLAWESPARARLIGLLPVTSAMRALTLPVPALVAWQAYAPLTVPLLDRDAADQAASALIDAASAVGACGLLLPSIATEGAAAQALQRAARVPAMLSHQHQRAMLDARQDGDAALESLGAKKLKELRRQRNRLADNGEVAFRVVTAADDVQAALEAFLALEAAGWKGARGTALGAKSGDAAFVREAVPALVRDGQARMMTLSAGDRIVATGVVLHHLDRAYFFKIAYDETLAKTSPGVQLTLDLTRALCADPAVGSVDSIAVSNHPMIDHIWRDRLAIADLLLPARGGAITLRPLAAVIAARDGAREQARRFVHFVRSVRGVRP